MARSPSCGGRDDEWGLREATAAPHRRHAALLGWVAGTPTAAAALRRLRQGAALSTPGLRRLLVDERCVAGCLRHGPRAFLDRHAPRLPSRIQGGAAVCAGDRRSGRGRADERTAARARSRGVAGWPAGP